MTGRNKLEPLTSWPLLPLPDAVGRMEFPTLAKSVRESIQIILRTQPGERLMRPEFGGGLVRMLNEQNTLSVRQEIKDLISDSLQRWEPRVVVDRVEVWEVEDDPTLVRRTAHGYGFASQLGTIQHLYRGVEGVHVEMSKPTGEHQKSF